MPYTALVKKCVGQRKSHSMEITIYYTLSAMRAVIDAPIAERRAIYRERLIEPLRDYWYLATKRINPQVTDDESLAMKMLWDVDLEQADLSEYARALDRLEEVAAGLESARRQANGRVGFLPGGNLLQAVQRPRVFGEVGLLQVHVP